MNNINKKYIEEGSIDLIGILKLVWINRKLIIISISSFFAIGIIVALISPVLYQSQTTFVPQVSSETATTSTGMSALSALGININQNLTSNDSYISPTLYDKIVDSEEFSNAIIKEELISLKGDRITIKDYMLSGNSNGKKSFNLIKFIKKYSIDLFKSDYNDNTHSEILDEYNFISNEDAFLIDSFRKKFTIEINQKEGFIKVIASDKNAFISTQLVKIITKKLQSIIIKLRTDKINEQLLYSKEEYEKKQLEFDILQNKLADFKDSNKNISSSKFLTQLQKLESEYRLQENIRISLATVYNNNKIKLNKDTPIFSVLDEVTIPTKRSKPRRSNILAFYTFIGLIIPIGYILIKDPINDIIEKIKEE